MKFSADFFTASELIQEFSDTVGSWQLLQMSEFDNATHNELNKVKDLLNQASVYFEQLGIYWKYREV